MQLILLGSVGSDECVPAYLTASGYETVRNRDRLEIREAELIQHLTKFPGLVRQGSPLEPSGLDGPDRSTPC